MLRATVYSIVIAVMPCLVSAEIVNGLFSKAVSALMKRLSSLKATTKTGKDVSGCFPILSVQFIFRTTPMHFNVSMNECAAIAGRPLMKFESGYTVETVFDGSKLGIEPYLVEVLPSGDLLILDSANSNLYKISSSLSLCE